MIVRRTPRQSNIELLRIVAMTMIVLHHIVVHARIDTGFGEPALFYLESICMFGVDIFVMISGWFRLRLSVRSVVRLSALVLVFGAIDLLLFRWGAGTFPKSGTDLLCFGALPLIYSQYWFILNYFLLMLLAPLLNKGLEAISDRYLTVLAATLVAANAMRATDGYDAYNFIVCYLCGVWLSRMYARNILAGRRYTVLCLAIICAGVAGLGVMIYRMDPSQPFNLTDFLCFTPLTRYTSPLVILPSLAALALTVRVRFTSRTVNTIASWALGVYMLQDGLYGHRFVYSTLHTITTTHTTAEAVAILAATVVLLWLASGIITIIVNAVFTTVSDRIYKRSA